MKKRFALLFIPLFFVFSYLHDYNFTGFSAPRAAPHVASAAASTNYDYDADLQPNSRDSSDANNNFYSWNDYRNNKSATTATPPDTSHTPADRQIANTSNPTPGVPNTGADTNSANTANANSAATATVATSTAATNTSATVVPQTNPTPAPNPFFLNIMPSPIGGAPLAIFPQPSSPAPITNPNPAPAGETSRSNATPAPTPTPPPPPPVFTPPTTIVNIGSDSGSSSSSTVTSPANAPDTTATDTAATGTPETSTSSSSATSSSGSEPAQNPTPPPPPPTTATSTASTSDSNNTPATPPPINSGGNIFSTGAVTFRFDDDIQSQYDVALPALQAAGFKGTFYVITRQLGDQGFSGYMTAAEVKQLAADGEEVGDHTLTHPHLPTLSSAQQRSEITGAITDLQAMGITPTSFSYPYGEYTPTTVQIVKDAGLSNAVTTIGGPASQNSDPFQIQSPSIELANTPAQIEQMIDSAIASHKWLILTFHNIDTGGDQYSITPQNFRTIVQYVSDRQIPVVTVSEGAAHLSK